MFDSENEPGKHKRHTQPRMHHQNKSFDETAILGKHRDKVAREVTEAFFLFNYGAQCVSNLSVALSEGEMLFLTMNRGRRGGSSDALIDEALS